ncbi:MAG: L-threonylcarbamoyladenylate synthase [bacterium]
MDQKKISQATAVLKEGGVIAYPTEGMYGLGCDPYNKTAVLRIIRMKQRQIEAGLILIGNHSGQVLPVTTMEPLALTQMTKMTWPGPTTWVLPCSDRVPDWIRGEQEGVAVRVSNHPIAAALTEDFGQLLVSTSANPHHMPPATNVEQVLGYFPNQIDFILEGDVNESLGASEIRDISSGLILRKKQ